MAILLSDIITQDESKWENVSSNYSAQIGENISADVSAGGFTITFPPTPASGEKVRICQGAGNFSVHNLTIDRNGNNIMGLAENMIFDIDYISVEFFFNGSEWRIA